MKAYPSTTHPAQVSRHSWFEAYRLFLMNPQEMLITKLLPLVAVGILPLSLADDLLIPFLGVADDIPTSILIAFIVFRTWLRVRKYR